METVDDPTKLFITQVERIFHKIQENWDDETQLKNALVGIDRALFGAQWIYRRQPEEEILRLKKIFPGKVHINKVISGWTSTQNNETQKLALLIIKRFFNALRGYPISMK